MFVRMVDGVFLFVEFGYVVYFDVFEFVLG